MSKSFRIQLVFEDFINHEIRYLTLKTIYPTQEAASDQAERLAQRHNPHGASTLSRISGRVVDHANKLSRPSSVNRVTPR